MLEEKAKALDQHKRNSLKARSPFDANLPRQYEDKKPVPDAKALSFDSSDSDSEEAYPKKTKQSGDYKKIT